jgi:hypothetical protein
MLTRDLRRAPGAANDLFVDGAVAPDNLAVNHADRLSDNVLRPSWPAAADRSPGLTADSPRLSRQRTARNAAERRYAILLEARLAEVLDGRRAGLDLLRTYAGAPGRVGILPTPADVARDELRPWVVKELTHRLLRRLCPGTVGSLTTRATTPGDAELATRVLPTVYPDVVVERIERRAPGARRAESLTWRVRRTRATEKGLSLRSVRGAAGLVLEFAPLVI